MKRTLIYKLALATRWVFVHTPREFALLLGSAIGLALWFTQRKDKFRTCRHLCYAYRRQRSLRYYHYLARGAFINSGYNLCDTFRLGSKFESELASLIDVIGLEHVRRAYKRGKGVICATGHIGNYELLAAYMGRNGFKTAAIGRELYDARLDALIVNNRLANHVENIPTTEPRQLVTKLRDGYVVGALIDNDSQKLKSVFVESYGRLAYTPIGATHIGLRLGAAFVPVTCRRIGKRYELRFFPEIEPGARSCESGVSGLSLREQRAMRALDVTSQIRKILDSEVDKDPTQWFWVHNRWRTRPN